MFAALLTIVVSLASTSGGDAQMARPCQADQFYDLVVGGCQLCKEICNDQILKEITRPCIANCPEYYRRMQLSQDNAATTQSSKSHLFGHFSSSSPWTNPLLWITFVSLSLAGMATIAIVIMMVCLRRQRIAQYRAVAKSAINDSSSSSSPSLKSDCRCSSPSPADVVVFDDEKTGKTSISTSPVN